MCICGRFATVTVLRAYLGDILDSVSLPQFATLRSQLLNDFIFSSAFDLAQHLSCSVKTVECGQIFLLACQQSQKKGSAIGDKLNQI